LEIAAKKLLLYKYLQHECSPPELEELGRWMQEEDQEEALHAILNEAWDELQLYPELEAEVSEDIFEQVRRSTGIAPAPGPAVEKPKGAAATAQWLFLAASMAVLLVLAVLPRK
jgi:hypothetical protein